MELSTSALNAKRFDEGHRNWLFAHLLAWYAAELIANAGIPAETIRENRRTLLENRAAQVEYQNLTIEALRANFETMNSQLELLGRPKCKSLSAP